MGGHKIAPGAALAAGWLLLHGWTGQGAELAETRPLFPPAATVVLMSGLPGDIENEHAYREQLQTLIETLDHCGHTGKVLVLSDNPEAAKAIAGERKIDFLKADRSHFLDLGQTLASDTNELVAVVWGHGGRQGATPVFHVRGPRLTAPDFVTFCGKAERPSRWLLMFRESGSFARQLAGSGRVVLSSDAETAFGSDPIAMQVLLRLLRANPVRPFASLVENLGRETSAWYSERNLARVEEPALWLGTEKPQLLAGLAAEARAADGSMPSDSTSGNTNKPVAPAPKVVQLEPAELPAVWKKLEHVSAKDFPDSDAVVLKRRVNYTFGTHPAVISEQEEFIQILTPEGKQFGDFDVMYSPPYEELSFLDCEVLSPEGKISRLDTDTIGESREQGMAEYQTGKRKFFSLPGIVPGAVLHVRYKTEWKNFPLPHISMEIPVGHEVPVREALVEISVPKETAFHFGFDGLPARDPELKQGAYGTSYSWRFEKLPAHVHEVLSARQHPPRLLVSTFPDWPAFSGWYERISQLTDEVTPAISERAKELSAKCSTDREKVLAIYNYVTRLRYVAIPLGVNSFRPHAAANVFQNQFGDCKDKANLFNTMLRALNIDAHLVLVPRFSQAYEAIPGLAFNHAISKVNLGGQIAWVDTTDEVCRFGLLPPGDPGRNVLVIDGHTNKLTQLPSPQPSDHSLKLLGKIDCSTADQNLPVNLQAVALGFPDYQLRSMAHGASEHRSSLPILEAMLRPTSGAFALEHQTATQVSALDETFTWHGEGSLVGLASGKPGKGHLNSPFWLPREWDLALHHRKSPLFLNQGYPLTLDEEFELKLPTTADTRHLPAAVENGEAPLRWKVAWTRLGDDKITARLHAELVHGEMTEIETTSVQRQLRELMGALAAGAEF